jgi:hypothetical protein
MELSDGEDDPVGVVVAGGEEEHSQGEAEDSAHSMGRLLGKRRLFGQARMVPLDVLQRVMTSVAQKYRGILPRHGVDMSRGSPG